MSGLSKSSSICSYEEEADLRRGPWTFEEDTLLINFVSCHGEGHWNKLAVQSGLKRTGKSCRLRWLNYLKPDIKRGNLTPQEQLLILELHSLWGNRWSKIAQHLPGRTDNEIKNYWRTRVQKQARYLNVDTNSTAFRELIRSFWIPRLVQKIQGSSYSSDSSVSPQNSASPDLEPQITQENMNTMDLTANPTVTYPQSMTIIGSQTPHSISEYPTSSFHDQNQFPNCCYNVDQISYDMKDFASHEPIGSCHVSASGWTGNSDTWSLEDSWQATSRVGDLESLFMGC